MRRSFPSLTQIEQLRRADPDAHAEMLGLLNAAKSDDEREFYESSLIEFFKRAWREIDGADLSINWHHEVIAEHLEAITYGEIRNLVVNVPPRHTKTLLTNVLYPAWVWARGERLPLSGPQVKFLCVSYGATLAEEIAVKMRRFVMGYWYQSLWGHRVVIQDDQKSRANFGNTAGGERISNSIEGGLLGKGGDIVLTDDPHSTQGAESDADRERTLRAFSEGLTTRITDPRIAARILIMQRLHQLDCTNWALENWTDVVHLMFPARFEPDRACPADRRSRPGELLWPEVWNNVELTKIEAGLVGIDGGEEGLSSYAVAGQLQQSPVPRGGGIIGPLDWELYPEVPPRPEEMTRLPGGAAVVPLPEVSYVVLALDTAMSERETADWNACVVFGVWHRRRNLVTQTNPYAARWAASRWSTEEDAQQRIVENDEQPRAILMEAWRRRGKLNDDTVGRDGKPNGLVQRVIETARRRKADRILIENKTRGKDVADELKRQMRDEEFQIEMFEPGRHGDKVARLHAVQPLFAQKLVYAPANCVLKTDAYGRESVVVEEFIWVNTVINEISSVPRGRHDDLADACSMGLLALRRDGFLSLTREFVQDSLRARLLQRDVEPVRAHYGV